MQIKKNLVLLLKAPKSDSEAEDKYETTLKEHGFEVKQVKTLNFEFRNLGSYRGSLDNPDLFSGLIFSSPRCVSATTLALTGDKLCEQWKSKDNYVVGEATHKQALDELGLDCLGKESGNANNLAEIMLKDKLKYTKPFLYPHGNLKMDLLKGRFGKEIELHEVHVYDTIANPLLEEELRLQTSDDSAIPEFVVFFSPSGVKASLSCICKWPLGAVKVIAIGPTTELCMKENNITIHGVAERPTPKDLIDAMLHTIESNES